VCAEAGTPPAALQLLPRANRSGISPLLSETDRTPPRPGGQTACASRSEADIDAGFLLTYTDLFRNEIGDTDRMELASGRRRAALGGRSLTNQTEIAVAGGRDGVEYLTKLQRG
jgi:hypothetical protein